MKFVRPSCVICHEPGTDVTADSDIILVSNLSCIQLKVPLHCVLCYFCVTQNLNIPAQKSKEDTGLDASPTTSPSLFSTSKPFPHLFKAKHHASLLPGAHPAQLCFQVCIFQQQLSQVLRDPPKSAHDPNVDIDLCGVYLWIKHRYMTRRMFKVRRVAA